VQIVYGIVSYRAGDGSTVSACSLQPVEDRVTDRSCFQTRQAQTGAACRPVGRISPARRPTGRAATGGRRAFYVGSGTRTATDGGWQWRDEVYDQTPRTTPRRRRSDAIYDAGRHQSVVCPRRTVHTAQAQLRAIYPLRQCREHRPFSSAIIFF